MLKKTLISEIQTHFLTVQKHSLYNFRLKKVKYKNKTIFNCKSIYKQSATSNIRPPLCKLSDMEQGRKLKYPILKVLPNKTNKKPH